ncbi:MAG: iron-sulfur cluster assembly scaffold protein [Ottowia sp.]|nr:iron-sulfur cluster assembly scaffold protein [Ottowia sp.]
MSACCAAATSPRDLTPWDCFERGLRTLRQPPLPLLGKRVAGTDGRWARFSLQLGDGRVQELHFACSHCATLIACCQALVDLNQGCAVQAPVVRDAAPLLARLPGVPASKQACAILAAAALGSALHTARTTALHTEPS